MSRVKAIEILENIQSWFLPDQAIHTEMSRAIRELKEEELWLMVHEPRFILRESLKMVFGDRHE